MQFTTYSNIFVNFTYNNVWSLLTKFWINEVINKKGYSKIWLTIIVNNNKNKSFTLINNLPFNINDYTDVLIVLRQQFKTIYFYDNDVIDSIDFKYYLEFKDDDYKKDLYSTNIQICIFVLLILVLLICSLIVLWIIFQTYNIEYIDEEILKYASKNIDYEEFNKTTYKRSIFSPFIELFDKKNNFPSKFVDKNLDEFKIWKSDDKSDNNIIFLDKIQDYESLVDFLVNYIISQKKD